MRCISALSIVVFHIFYNSGGGLTYIPLRFGVQTFFFISGFLYATRQIVDVKKFYKTQTVKIAVPTAMAVLLGIALCLIFAPEVDKAEKWLTYGANQLWGQGQIWFMPFILICYFLLPVLNAACDKTDENRNRAIILLAIISIIELCFYIFGDLQFCIVVFEIGYLVRKFEIDEKFKRRRALSMFGGIIVFVFAAFAYYVMHNKVVLQTFLIDRLIHFGEMFSAALLALSFSLIILLCFERMNDKPLPKILRLSDKYSLYVFLSHHIFCMGPVSVLTVLPSFIQNVALLILCIVFSSVTLRYFSDKIISKLKKRLTFYK